MIVLAWMDWGLMGFPFTYTTKQILSAGRQEMSNYWLPTLQDGPILVVYGVNITMSLQVSMIFLVKCHPCVYCLVVSMCLFIHDWHDDPQWRAYFSDGLKPSIRSRSSWLMHLLVIFPLISFMKYHHCVAQIPIFWWLNQHLKGCQKSPFPPSKIIMFGDEIQICLVVWNHGFLWLSIYWEWKIIPTDFKSIIFQRGRSTTNQSFLVMKSCLILFSHHFFVKSRWFSGWISGCTQADESLGLDVIEVPTEARSESQRCHPM